MRIIGYLILLILLFALLKIFGLITISWPKVIVIPYCIVIGWYTILLIGMVVLDKIRNLLSKKRK